MRYLVFPSFLHFLALNSFAPLCQVMNNSTHSLHQQKQCLFDKAVEINIRIKFKDKNQKNEKKLLQHFRNLDNESSNNKNKIYSTILYLCYLQLLRSTKIIFLNFTDYINWQYLYFSFQINTLYNLSYFFSPVNKSSH